MKKVLCFSAVLLISTSVVAEESWWNTILNTLGLGEQSQDVASGQEVPEIASQTGDLNIQGLISHLTSRLNVSEAQAQGGLASLMNYAKQSLSEEQFAVLANQLPGVQGILTQLPDVSNVEQGGLGGLLAQASQFSESLGPLSDLQTQFEALGLDTTMIMSFVEQARGYLNTPEGLEARQLLMESFSNLQL